MGGDPFDQGYDDCQNLGPVFHWKYKGISRGMVADGEKKTVSIDVWVKWTKYVGD